MLARPLTVCFVLRRLLAAAMVPAAALAQPGDTLTNQPSVAKDPDQAQVVWQLSRSPQFLDDVYETLGQEGYGYTARTNTESNQPGSSKAVFAVSSKLLPGTVPLYVIYRGSQASSAFAGDRSPVNAPKQQRLGYVFPNFSSGLEAIHVWTNGTIVRLSLGNAAPPGLYHLKIIGYTFASDFPRRVGVYYFGMFSPRAWGQTEGVKKNIIHFWGKLPQDFWWSGVRDLHDHHISPLLRQEEPESDKIFAENWEALKPAIGWYDQSKTETLEKHIDQAVSNGISFFNFYWYWSSATKAEYVNDGLDSFLKARNSDKIDFAIAICEHGWQLSLPEEQFSIAVQTLVTKYLSRKNYLKLRDGRLIVQICDPKGIHRRVQFGEAESYSAVDDDAVREFVRELRDATERLLGKRLFVLVRQDGVLPLRLAQDGFDGGTCIAPILDWKNSFANYHLTRLWIDGHSRSEKFMPCLAQRHDERPRIGIMKHADQITYPQHWVSPELFGQGLEEMRSWMDKRADDEVAQFLTLYAWNEWHEGGILEPNVKDGAAYINRIPAVMGVPFIPIGR